MKGSGGSGLILANGPVSPITYEQALAAGITVVEMCPKEDVALVLEALGIADILSGLDQED